MNTYTYMCINIVNISFVALIPPPRYCLQGPATGFFRAALGIGGEGKFQEADKNAPGQKGASQVLYT